MERITEYRKMALGYLYTRAAYLTEEVDEILDFSLRLINNLKPKPEKEDQYNELLGLHPIKHQRRICCRLLFKELTDKSPTELHYVDKMIDKAIRTLNKIPFNIKSNNVYINLFSLDKEEKVKPEIEQEEMKSKFNKASYYSIDKKGIELIHSFESYRECTYKDPGSNNGLPITG